ncbi:hypothetical protein B0T24DRAFT_242785 [Lasiosphaeria ovina]|uniref:Uncharacterized protein n=1 Tax=Lasiosphaeria ovina TaxID=92902 RepID=A0AAE0KBD0_9PEZI|nr:hypothetical protein B0T24DRAFT_242785 [Lasiosphaeria ovina]
MDMSPTEPGRYMQIDWQGSGELRRRKRGGRAAAGLGKGMAWDGMVGLLGIWNAMYCFFSSSPAFAFARAQKGECSCCQGSSVYVCCIQVCTFALCSWTRSKLVFTATVASSPPSLDPFFAASVLTLQGGMWGRIELASGFQMFDCLLAGARGLTAMVRLDLMRLVQRFLPPFRPPWRSSHPPRGVFERRQAACGDLSGNVAAREHVSVSMRGSMARRGLERISQLMTSGSCSRWWGGQAIWRWDRLGGHTIRHAQKGT